MVNTRRIASAVQAGLTLGACLFGLVSSAHALSTSDRPAAILVWPKIIVDTSHSIESRSTDTVIQLGNVESKLLKQAHCFYINANSHCAETAAQPGKVCKDSTDCPLATTGFAPCVPGWSEIDFDIRITPEQPLAWRASEGLARDKFPLPDAGVCSNHPSQSCNPSSSINPCGLGTCVPVASNAGSGIPPTPEDPFYGTMKCIQFDPTQNPPAPDQSVVGGSLIGSALIEEKPEAEMAPVDVERYNAVGIPFIALDTTHPGEVHLDGAQYANCPSTLILNHIFDGAPNPLSTITDGVPGVFTDLTLVPCGDDILRQDPGNATAQYLVFNEFEQRLSTSRKVDCFFEKQLSLIDTGTPTRSIFSFAVQGSLVGQTRIRGVGTAPTGHGLLGVAITEVDGSGVAYNLQQSGTGGTDIITIP